MSNFPHGEDIKGRLIECPKCRGRMTRLTTGDLSVDRCGACGGLWLDALELERVIAAAGQAEKIDKGPTTVSDRMDGRRQIACPRDKSPLIAMSDPRQLHVRYEKCTVCGGVFLDGGELQDLAEFNLLERLRTMFG